MLRNQFSRAEWLLAAAIAMALTPAAAIVYLVFAPICAAVALFLLLRQPANYISFTFWVWMLTPLVRRVVDYHTTFHANSVVMIAPLLVTAVSGIGLFSRAPVREHAAAGSYLVFIGVVLFGFFIGAPSAGIVAALFDLLNWALPAIFAFYLLRAPLPAELIAGTIFKALTWGALVMGAYGIYQYFFLPSWDSAWMITSHLGSIGAPVPREVRVFGPLNSPGPYAIYMTAGILIAMNGKARMKWFATVPAAVGLMLSLVRSAWGGCAVGILAIIIWSPVREKVRYLMIIAAAVLFVAPIIAFTPVGETVSSRAESLNRLDDDTSFIARQRLYSELTSHLVGQITGVGLAHTNVAGKLGDVHEPEMTSSIDSGILEIFFAFGLIGTVMLGALIAITIKSMPSIRSSDSVAAWSVAISGLSCIVFGNTLVSSQGMLVLPLFALATRCKMSAPTITRQRVPQPSQAAILG